VTAVIFDDRTADRKPHPHAVGFGRKEWVKDAPDDSGIDSRSGVLNYQRQTVRVMNRGFERTRAVDPRRCSSRLWRCRLD
jgi:hypothetical protein